MSGMLQSASHAHPIEIRPPDIDALGHANNATYLTWVQAAVLSHWHALAPADAIAMFRWVAVKHEITYRKPALLGDSLVATVVLERVQRESAFYDTSIRRGPELVAEARSRWCCVDAATLRPARLPQEVVAAFFREDVLSTNCPAGAFAEAR
jgi:acyl-CoA thioester hydrolase